MLHQLPKWTGRSGKWLPGQYATDLFLMQLFLLAINWLRRGCTCDTGRVTQIPSLTPMWLAVITRILIALCPKLCNPMWPGLSVIQGDDQIISSQWIVNKDLNDQWEGRHVWAAHRCPSWLVTDMSGHQINWITLTLSDEMDQRWIDGHGHRHKMNHITK